MNDENFKDDYEALLEMARDKTAAGRATLDGVIEDLKSDTNDVLTDRDRALMSGMLRRVIHEMEMRLRTTLVDRLTAIEEIPDEVIAAIGEEETEIVYPILAGSHFLLDRGLIELIYHRTLQHQTATGIRNGIDDVVSARSNGTAREDTIKNFLDDPNTRIARAATAYLVAQSKSVDGHQNPILKLEDVDSGTAQRVYRWASAALRKYITESLDFQFDPTDLDLALDESIKEMSAAYRTGEYNQSKAAELTALLDDAGRIDPELILAVLEEGEFPLFENMFAAKVGLRPLLLRRIMFEPGGEALAVACKAIDIPAKLFANIFLLTRKTGPSENTVGTAELNRVLDLYDRIGPQSARAVVSRWQRDPDYLNALRLLTTA